MLTLSRLLLTIVSVLLVSPVVVGAAGGADTATWPHFRGPSFDGRSDQSGVFDDGGFGLDISWNIPLGPGYSAMAVSDGLVITLYSDGTDDVAEAFDTATGKSRWRYRIDSTYRGHDGSTDGPLSSPVVADGLVHGLGARGQLFTLRLEDGSEVWSVRMQDSFGSKEPDYGFTTTPLVAGDHLIVQAGGKSEKSLVALDRKTGALRWATGDQHVDYQSPAVLQLAGRQQVVALAGNTIVGIEPTSGEELWQHQVAEEDQAGSAIPIALGEDRFLILAGTGALAFHLVETDGEFRLQEAYRSAGLGRNYALPVLYEGHLYGFRGNFLTCVRADNGETVWRSRPPGGRGLILVDGHLVVLGSGGEVVVARATPEGFQERARVQAFDGTGYTWPSFAGDQIFVRNLDSMAAVRVTEKMAAASGESGETHGLATLVREVEKAENRQARLQEMLQKVDSFPWIEGDLAHLVYQGDASDVAVVGAMAGAAGSKGMHHLEGTDFFYRTFRLDPASRWEYHFLVDLEERVADPLHSRTVPAPWGDLQFSELVMPGYSWVEHTAEPEGKPRGTVDTFTFKSASGIEREARAWLPPGYAAEKERSFPLLLVHGLDWLDRGLMGNSLDNLLERQVEPVVVVFLAPRDEWWLEGGGSGTTEYVEMLAKELVPFLEGKYRLLDRPEARAVMGTEGFGLTALYAVLSNPGVFAKAAVGSIHLGAGSGDALMGLIEGPKREGIEIYLDWNKHDRRQPDSGIDLAGDSRKLAERLASRGYSPAGGEVADSYGWGADRARAGRVLEALFPAGR